MIHINTETDEIDSLLLFFPINHTYNMFNKGSPFIINGKFFLLIEIL